MKLSISTVIGFSPNASLPTGGSAVSPSLDLEYHRTWGARAFRLPLSTSQVPLSTTVAKCLGGFVAWRYWTKDVCEVEYRVHNGVVDVSTCSALGKLYYRGLSVSFTSDDEAIAAVSEARPNESWVTTGRRLAWGYGQPPAAAGQPQTDNVFLPRQILARRFVLYASNVAGAKEQAEAVLHYKHLRSQFAGNAVVKNYGPLLLTQPKVDRAAHAARFASLADAVRGCLGSGTPLHVADFVDCHTAALGVLQPDDFPDPAAPAGYNIHPCSGWEQCAEALDYHRLMHGMTMDRERSACVASDGGLVGPWTWATADQAIPDSMKGEPDQNLTNLNEVDAFLQGDYYSRRYRVANEGTCSYEEALSDYLTHDNQHQVRAWHHLRSLWEHTGCPAFAWDFSQVVLAGLHGGGYAWRPDCKLHANYNGDYVPRSLSLIQAQVLEVPHQGHPSLDRGFGWTMSGMAWLLRCFDALPAEVKGQAADHLHDWSAAALTTYAVAADESGLTQREQHTPYMPADVLGTQHFHSVISALGALELRAVVERLDGVPYGGVAQAATKHVDRVVNPDGALKFEQRYEMNGAYGPPKWPWTAHVGVPPAPAWPGTPISPLSNAQTGLGDGAPSGFPEHCSALVTRVQPRQATRTLLAMWHPAASVAERRAFLENPTYLTSLYQQAEELTYLQIL